MIRATLIALLLLATPAFAQEHEDDHGEHAEEYHDEHVAELDGLRAIHAWARATSSSTAQVFVALENTGEDAVTLRGGEAEIAATVTLVGFQLVGGESAYVALPEMPIPAGREIVLAPNGLALELAGLTRPLVQGEHFEMEIEFDTGHLEIVVEIESATATQHSHAGHNH